VVNISAGDNLAVALNAAAANVNGDVLIFVDASLTPVSNGWVEELTGFAMQIGVGAVGAKIIDHHTRVIDGALIIGGEERVSVAHHGYYSEEPGSMVRNMVTGNFSAVSLAFMAITGSELAIVARIECQ